MSARGPSKAAQTGSGGSSQSTEPSARASIATGSTPCVVAKTTRSPDSRPASRRVRTAPSVVWPE